jgi:hypothetical protein
VIFILYVNDLLINILVAILSHLFAGILLAKQRHRGSSFSDLTSKQKVQPEQRLFYLTAHRKK